MTGWAGLPAERGTALQLPKPATQWATDYLTSAARGARRFATPGTGVTGGT